jgi:hypothetical protein
MIIVSEVRVVIDDRGRLVTAVLAAGDWPEREQAQERHAVHPHAKQTRHFVESYGGHPAVQGADARLAQLDGDVTDLFTAAFRCRWPDFRPEEAPPAGWDAAAWLATLPDFWEKTAVSHFWAEHAASWQKAGDELGAIWYDSKLTNFLRRLTKRPLRHDVAIMPNLVYPALRSVLAETRDTLYLLIPPPKAVGESPPWPYDEAPDWVLSQAGHYLVHYALQDEIDRFAPEKRPLLLRGAITLFLEEALDEAEAMAYMLRSKKQYDLPQLPLAIESLRQHLKTKEQTFPEFFL